MFYKFCVLIVMFAVAALVVNLIFALIGFILIRVLPFIMVIVLGGYFTYLFLKPDPTSHEGK